MILVLISASFIVLFSTELLLFINSQYVELKNEFNQSTCRCEGDHYRILNGTESEKFQWTALLMIMAGDYRGDSCMFLLTFHLNTKLITLSLSFKLRRILVFLDVRRLVSGYFNQFFN